MDVTTKELETDAAGARRPTPIHFRFSFFDSAVREAIAAEVARRFAVDLDLVEGRFDKVGDAAVGTLTLEARGDPHRIAEAVRYLRDRKLLLELRAGDHADAD
jgi:D-methionine transport system ATP-binding protein